MRLADSAWSQMLLCVREPLAVVLFGLLHVVMDGGVGEHLHKDPQCGAKSRRAFPPALSGNKTATSCFLGPSFPYSPQ